ncbi:MAG TPA: fluoride efflux transporter CrcB [Burkholderiales bacterium]|nr:fluoride efflux transporter CrcB [Burkholderiales bacterium]
MDTKSILLVALGGGLGSIARHLLSGWVLHRAVAQPFPAGTFLVNIIGCFAVGLLAGLAVKHEFFSASTRLFLFTGIAGGFTTFSAFGLETFHLLRKGDLGIAAGYVTLSVLVGLLVVWVGFVAIPQRSN